MDLRMEPVRSSCRSSRQLQEREAPQALTTTKPGNDKQMDLPRSPWELHSRTGGTAWSVCSWEKTARARSVSGCSGMGSPPTAAPRGGPIAGRSATAALSAWSSASLASDARWAGSPQAEEGGWSPSRIHGPSQWPLEDSGRPRALLGAVLQPDHPHQVGAREAAASKANGPQASLVVARLRVRRSRKRASVVERRRQPQRGASLSRAETTISGGRGTI